MNNTKTQKQRTKSAAGRQMTGNTTQAAFETENAPLRREENYEPSREEVAALAQRIYEEQGYPDGCADGHWYEAERRLRQRGPAHDPLAIA